MNRRAASKLVATTFGLALLLAGCGSGSNNDGGSGTGGMSSTGTGGTMGTGGVATGGSGAATGSAGTVGAGTGGVAGGTSGSGGSAGTSGSGGAGGAKGTGGQRGGAGASGSSLTLTSPDQADNAKFGTMFTCAAMNGTFGAGINPELDWSGVPAGTMSFAITFIDTKIGANMAMGQHWAIWDIPDSVMEFPKGTTMLTGALAGAMQTNKYLAPCPSGNDTYEYTLYALSSATLDVSGASGSGTANSAGVAKVLAALEAVTPLAAATLHGTSGPMGQ